MHSFHRRFFTASIRTFAPSALALALWLTPCAAQAQVPTVAPTGGIWSAGDGFAFRKMDKKDEKATRQAVSGIACGPDAERRNICLLAFDEGVVMQFAEIGDGRLKPSGERIKLGDGGEELDAEGAATDGRYFYLTGSHAVKRKSCATNPASHHVLRVGRNARTGLATSAMAPRDQDGLLALIEAFPAFKPDAGAGKCLGKGGIDIEGLAVRRGRLFFGLRGPTEQDTAFIVSVDADAFFDGGDAKPKLSRVKVGAGRGLRDMVAVGDGILLLAGPDDADHPNPPAWQVLHWDDTTEGAAATPRPLATLDLAGVARRKCDKKEIKPEAMTVLDETTAAYRLLVLSDGLCDGGAMVFDLKR